MNQIIFIVNVTQLRKPSVGRYNLTPEMSILELIGPFALGNLGDTDIFRLWSL